MGDLAMEHPTSAVVDIVALTLAAALAAAVVLVVHPPDRAPRRRSAAEGHGEAPYATQFAAGLSLRASANTITHARTARGDWTNAGPSLLTEQIAHFSPVLETDASWNPRPSTHAQEGAGSPPEGINLVPIRVERTCSNAMGD